MDQLEFKEGDRVRLTPPAVAFYGGVYPHFIPQAQGGGTDGTILFAGERPHKPGAAPRPYYVRWDSGAENSYRSEDLAPAGPPPGKQEPNIIPFRR